MFALLVPTLFVSIGWFAHDPVSLFSSSVLFVFVLAKLVSTKKINWQRSSIFILAFLLPFTYIISAIVNNQSLASLFLGGYQRNYGLATILALSLLFIISATGNLHMGKYLSFGLLFTLILANSYGYLQYFDLDPFPWTNPLDAVTLTLGNPNFSGALFGILSVVVFAKIISSEKIIYRLAFLLLLLSTIFLSFQTKSLQSQLLIIIGILTFLLVYSIGQKSPVLKLVKILCFLVFFLISVGLIALLGLTRLTALKEKFFFEASVPQRLNYWQNGINIWQDNFIFGVGADQFQRYAAFYRTPEQIVLDGNMVIPDKAHSVFIDHLANGGLSAGLIWMIFVSVIYFALFKSANSDLTNRLEISILAGVWTAYVAQALISPDQILLSVIGYTSAGLILNEYLCKKESVIGAKFIKRNNPNYIRVCVALILLVSIVIFSRAISANIAAKNMLDGKLPEAQSYLDVLDSWPNPFINELLGVQLVKDQNNCQLTELVADRLIKIDDRSSQGWFMKAICSDFRGEYSKAIEFVNNSLKYDPLNLFYLISKVELEIADNRLTDALRTLSKVETINPLEPNLTRLEARIINLNQAN